MVKYICQNCRKEFFAKPSAKRKFCSKKCAWESCKGQPLLKNRKERIKVICKECNKEEYVQPCRAQNYVCCSTKCLSQYNARRYSKKYPASVLFVERNLN